MASASWTDNTDNWTTPQDWSTGTVPGSTDDVTIAQGEPTITSYVGSVQSLNIASYGALIVNGYLRVDGSLTNYGSISMRSGTLYIGGTASGSSIDDSGAFLEFANAASNNFSGGLGARLILDDPKEYTGSATLASNIITRVGPFINTIPGSTIQLTGQIFSSYTYDGKSFLFTLSDGSSEMINVSNAESASNQNGNIIIDPTTVFGAVCFTSGSRILTDRGYLLVESLRPGDIVFTASGDLRRIVWIGQRTIDAPSIDQGPVRIYAHAFRDCIPSRDLFLSPGHPVLVGADADGEGGHLVPIMCLVNGTTIERMPVDTVTYWHVELDVHDILLAENLPPESYIDLGSRVWFAGADGALYDPDMALPGMSGRCRPVAVDGPVVEAERRRLDAVFAARLACAADWPSAAETLFV